MVAYPSRQEFFALGLPARAFVAPAQSIVAVDAASDVLTIPGHGYADGDRVRATITPGGGGVPSAVLPAGLSGTVLYFVKDTGPLGGDMLRLSLTNGGAAVDVTDAGTPIFGLVRDAGPDIDLALEAWSRYADQKLTGHSTPLTSAPAHLKAWVSHLAAYDLATSKGLVSPEYRDDPALAERAKRAAAELDALENSGKELAGAADATPDFAENGASSWSDGDRGWGSI